VFDRMIILGERHLRRVLREYLDHYHAERPLQGLDGRLIEPRDHDFGGEGAVRRRQRLGGMLSFHYREAALG
jgi:hypothetical protein